MTNQNIDEYDKDFQFIKTLKEKFKKLTPEKQIIAITKITELTETTDNDLKSLFSSFKDFLVHVKKTSLEPFDDLLSDSPNSYFDMVKTKQKETIADLENLQEL